MEILYCVLIGSVSGTLGGLLGIGGGLIIVPLLTFMFIQHGFPYDEIPRLAVGTSQSIIIFISLSAVYSQYKKKMFILSQLMQCLPAIIAGTCLGGLAILFAPARMLTLIFCCALISSIIILFFSIHGSNTRNIRYTTVFFPLTVISAISSSAGIGGGGLFTAYFSFLNFPIKDAIALSMSLVLPMSFTTTLYVLFGHSSVEQTVGFVYYPAFLSMILPAILCARLGVIMRVYIPHKLLQSVLSCMLVVSAIYLLYKTF